MAKPWSPEDGPWDPRWGLSPEERDAVYANMHNGKEVRRRRDAYRKANPFTPAMLVTHIMRGIPGHQELGDTAFTLDEAGFEVDWDTVEDEDVPFVVTWPPCGTEVVVEPWRHHSGMLRWRGMDDGCSH